MTTTAFDPALDLILVQCLVAGPRKQAMVRLVVDTGATMTILRPEVMDDVGYSARDGYGRSTVSSASGEEHGYRLRVARFVALGFERPSFPVAIHDLPHHDLDGLLGLNFLRRFNYEIRSREGRIRLEPA